MNVPFPGGKALCSIVLFLAVACLVVPVRAEPPVGKKWKLIWSDDFDGRTLDEAKWERVGDGRRKGGFWLKEDAYLDGKGVLVIRSKKEGDRYSCGGLRTRGKFQRAFGFYEIRCKVPSEVGTWAAFWLYSPVMGRVGNGGEDGAEIDIFEAPWRGEDRINIALHWDGYGKNHKSAGWKVPAPGLNKGFHTFGLDWSPQEYVFYYDGKEVKRTSVGGVCQVPLYIKVTSEIGSWAGDITKAKLPDYFIVDYVRVYEAEQTSPAGEENEEK
jgi:beta-glucanase (GH16 family)